MAVTPDFAAMVEKAVEDMKQALATHVRIEYGVQTEIRDEVAVDPVDTEEVAIQIAAKYHPSWKAQVVTRTVVSTPWVPR